eukprot:169870_1
MAELVDVIDPESQQFLSLSDYGPTSTTTTTQSKRNDSIDAVTQNDVLSVAHAHPKAAFFTILFKALAVLAYVFGSWITSNFILIFVFVILCLACDFWAVKNVTGRLLVGLRWWNHVKDDGTSEWKFETKSNDNISKNQHKDSRLFWTSLYLTPAIWILLCIACIVKFNIKWLPLTLVGIALNTAQLWGYWKCRRDANKQANEANAEQGYLAQFTQGLFAQKEVQNAIGSQIANQFQTS